MGTEIDELLETYISDNRKHSSGGPWTMLNMISSQNGLATLDGKSGPLGGPADKELFRTLRGVADVILVAAGTVRTENYTLPVITERTAQIRKSENKAPLPKIVVLTNSLDLDPESSLFCNPDYQPIILTSTSRPKRQKMNRFKNAEIIQIEGSRVNLEKVLPKLTEKIGSIILVEGGPSLNQQLVEKDLFDELCITISPVSSSDKQAQKIITAESYTSGKMILDRSMHVGDFIFKRFLRKRQPR
tara:strand:+ start:178 stop:912 length:735 start_codon:yes stop_codon:yes gene_type:complete